MIRPGLAALLGAWLAALAIDAAAADLRKVVRTALRSSESKLDPQAESDEASGSINESIFDALLEYDYLARPAKLRPRTAVALPEVNAEGTVYILKVKPGIRFTPDPAFKGKPRELVAADYVYSLRRLMDPVMKSQWLFLVEGKIKGADAVMAEARKTNRYDYDRPIEGLRALDRYTLRIELNTSDFGFANVLALQATSAVAREVVEFYGDDIAAHPVGTGPFLLKSWTRGSKLVLEANPDYRDDRFEGDSGDNARSREIAARLRGQRIPIVGRIEIYVIDEDQPRWLAFLNGEHDYIRPVPEDFAQLALPNGEVAPNLRRKGITATPDEIAYTTYTTFNMQPEIDGRKNDVGGYTPERIALRRAIAMAYRIDDQIALLDKHQSTRAHSPLPPGVAGHDPAFVSPTLEYNPAKAKALLDMFGFVDRDGDGYRENPDGTPLVFDHAWYPRQRERQRNQLWKSSMDDIGIRVTFDNVEKLPELRKQARVGKVQSFSYGWIADYPDGENFLQLMWKGSVGQANYSMFDLPEYNALYEKAKRLPDGPERSALYERMVKIICVYVPWMVETYKQETILMQPWLLNYRKHPFSHEPWRYLDVDMSKQPKN
ncbi:MAG TPA: ABC transporter substrate-binding protein [Usitatibacter sp.]|nr:ABC transporter substrate-binding protein [Usitatibacter sp.]